MSPSKSPPPHSLLFLDIDGVLNTTSTMLSHPGTLRFAPSAVAALKKILAASDCRIVLTSTRRRDGLAAIRQAFLANGLPEAAERLIDSTPILSDSDTDSLRSEEIQSWLEENHFTGPYAIFDDALIPGHPPPLQANRAKTLNQILLDLTATTATWTATPHEGPTPLTQKIPLHLRRGSAP